MPNYGQYAPDHSLEYVNVFALSSWVSVDWWAGMAYTIKNAKSVKGLNTSETTVSQYINYYSLNNAKQCFLFSYIR